MTLLVGLGNPGSKYTETRHNAGFMVLDALTEETWNLQKSMEAETIEVGETALVKPQAYMNKSGQAVYKALKKYDYSALGKKDFSRMFVVYDDLDIPVGKYKLIFGSGPKVHNGVNSIIETLGSDQFWHVRIGVDGRNGDRSIPPEEYVLSGFRADERELFARVIDGVASLLAQHIK